jgi:hypothetical protein
MACECCGACRHDPDDGDKKSWDVVIQQALSNDSITVISSEAVTVRTLILDAIRKKACTWIERAKAYERDND